MEWIILVALVPAVIVPVVLLFGFAGCAQVAGIETINIIDPTVDHEKAGVHHEDPFITLETNGEHSIHIKLGHPNSKYLSSIDVFRTPALGGPKAPVSATGEEFDDETGLSSGVTYVYDVEAVYKDGHKTYASDTATTWAHDVYFAVTTTSVGSEPLSDCCLVQAITPNVKGPPWQTKDVRGVVVTLLSTQDLTISAANVSLSALLLIGGEPWDSVPGTRREILAPGDSRTVYKDTHTVIERKIPLLTVPAGSVLLIAFDIDAGFGAGAVWKESQLGMIKQGVHEAMVDDRTGPYQAKQLVLVEKVEFSIVKP